MEYKEYKKLNFDELYKTKQYPEKTWPILNEYFSRYKSEFDLNDDQISQKCNRILENLDTIKKEKSDNKYRVACFNSFEKAIKINPKNMKNKNFTDIIFHEITHAGEHLGQDSSTSFQSYNPKTNRHEGVCINEIITEMKSTRLACNDRINLVKKSGDKRKTIDVSGYGDLAFIGTMLHTTLGISEKEFLTLADKGREEFDKQMREKFLPGDKTYDNFMNSIMYNSDVLHAIKYNSNRTPDKEDKINIKNSIDSIRNQCLLTMKSRMEYEAFKNKDSIDIDEFSKKSRYEFEKIEANYRKGLSDSAISPKKAKTNEYVDDVKKAIMQSESVYAQRENLSDSQFSEILQGFAEGSNIGEDFESKYGIKVSNNIQEFDRPIDVDYETELLKSEYGDKPWDNSGILKDIKSFSKEDKIQKTEKESIKPHKKLSDFFKNIISGNKKLKETKALPQSSIASQEEILGNENKEKNGILQDLSNMVKSDTEYLKDSHETKDRVQQKDSKDYMEI